MIVAVAIVFAYSGSGAVCVGGNDARFEAFICTTFINTVVWVVTIIAYTTRIGRALSHSSQATFIAIGFVDIVFVCFFFKRLVHWNDASRDSQNQEYKITIFHFLAFSKGVDSRT
jgi:hypothetical protein